MKRDLFGFLVAPRGICPCGTGKIAPVVLEDRKIFDNTGTLEQFYQCACGRCYLIAYEMGQGVYIREIDYQSSGGEAEYLNDVRN